jgi:hypothetical protein
MIDQTMYIACRKIVLAKLAPAGLLAQHVSMQWHGFKEWLEILEFLAFGDHCIDIYFGIPPPPYSEIRMFRV